MTGARMTVLEEKAEKYCSQCGEVHEVRKAKEIEQMQRENEIIDVPVYYWNCDKSEMFWEDCEMVALNMAIREELEV